MAANQPNRLVGKGLTVVTFAALAGALFIVLQPGIPSTSPPLPPAIEGGVDTAFALIVSSKCEACTKPEFKRLIREQLALYVNNRLPGRGPRFIGIAIDRNPIEGLAMLQSLGSFDEISVGGGWASIALGELIWKDTLGTGAVPQVVRVIRDLDTSANRYRERSRSIKSIAVGSGKVGSWLVEFNAGI